MDTTRTVEISYVVRNGIRYFEDHDEFYWNVTGNDWPVPIDHAEAHVYLPKKAAGTLRAQAFTGVYGSAQRDATSEVNGADVAFETTNPLPMRGGMTIDIFIPKGILKEPGALTRAFWFLGSNPIVFLPFVTFAVMYVLWWYKGRDPDPGRSVAPMYEPPPGMSPAEAGALIDDTIHPRDITSTIVDLAVRGYIKIEETVDTTLLVFHSKDYIFHLLKPLTEWQGLAPHERVMLENIFAGGQQTRLSSLKNRFYTAIPVIKQDIKAALKNKGMYLLDPDSANGYSIGAALVIAGPVSHRAIQRLQTSIQLGCSSDRVRHCLRHHLVAVRAPDVGENGAGRAHPYCGAGLPGVHESRGRRPPEAHAAGHVRKIPALCHGARSGASLGAGLCRDHPEPAELVRVAQWHDRLQSDIFLQFDAQHGIGHEPGVRLRAALEFQWFRFWRGWRRRLLWRRIRRRRRQRVLKVDVHLPSLRTSRISLRPLR